MARYAKYHVASGRITGLAVGEAAPVMPEGFDIIELGENEDCDPDAHYIAESSLQQRTPFNAAKSRKTVVDNGQVTLTGFPSNGWATINGTFYQADANGVLVADCGEGEEILYVEFVGEHSGQQTVSVYTLAMLKEERCKLIQEGRDNYAFGGVNTPFGRVQTTTESKVNALGAAFMAFMAKSTNTPFSRDWTMEDNTVQTLDADEMITMGSIIASHVDEAYVRGRVLKDRVLAATDVNGVMSVVWSMED